MGTTTGSHPIRTLLVLGAFLAAGVGWTLYAGLSADSGAPDEPLVTTDAPAGKPGATDAAKPGAAGKYVTPVHVENAAKVRGIVRLYRSKEPVAGLELSLKPADGIAKNATTAADGSFLFDELPPTPGWELHGTRDPYAPISLPLDLAEKEDKDLGTLWLEVPVELTAIVMDLTGKPLKGAKVDVFAVDRAGTIASSDNQNWWWDRRAWEQRVLAVVSNPKPTKSATTGEDGKASIAGLMPGTYRARAAATGCATTTRGGILLAPDAAPAPVKLVLGPGHKLVGTVTDEKEKPVAGATVIAANGDDWNVGLDKWSAQTNEKGAFSIEGLASGRTTIYLDRSNKPLLLVGSVGVPETTRYDIRLRPGGTIRGTVSDEDGKPVAGAEIRMAMQNSWSPMAAMTAKDGKFELLDIPAGPLAYFRIDCPGYTPYPDPSSPAQGQGESLREGAVMVRDIILRRGLTAELHVLASDTNGPLEGCECQLMVVQQWGGGGQPWKATTDKDGVGKVSGLVPGNYLVVLRAPGYVQEGLPPWFTNLLSSPDAMPSQWRLNVGGEGGSAKGEYKLTRGAVVTGHVWDQNKQPVAGARVTVQGAKNEFPVFSGADGTYKVDAVAPSNRCQTSAAGPSGTRGTSDPFIVNPGQTVENIDVRLAACGRVCGTVRTPDGKSPVGTMVRFVMGRLDERNSWAFRQFQSAERYPVGPDGRFEMDAVPEGNCTIRADAEGYLPAWKNDVMVHAGQDTSGCELILKTSVEIAGRVEGQSGGTISGAQIFIQYAGTGDRRSRGGFIPGLSGDPSAQTDGDGKFVLKGLQEGNYTIWANAPSFASGTRVQTKTGAGDVLIRLAPGKKISGKVTDEAQNPVGGVPVNAQKMDQSQQNDWWWGGAGQVYTAPDGTFEMTELADGTYDLTVSAMWTWGREVNVEDTKLQGVTAGRTDVAITVKTGSVIEGRIMDRDGKPVRVAWITAQFESTNPQNQDWSSQRWAQARPDGTFRVVGLKPGPYTLWAYGDFKYIATKGVSAGTKDAKIQVEPGYSIWGKVVDVQGLSLGGGCNFQVRKAGETNWMWMNVVQPGDGNFVVLGLDQGNYDLQVMADGYAPAIVPNVTAGARELSVVLQKGMEMAGVIVDGSGNGVAGSTIEAYQLNATGGAQPSQSSAQADATGAFKLSGLAAGEYRVIVRGNNLAPAVMSPVQAGNNSLKFVLESGVSITGTIADESGTALGTGINGNLQLNTTDGMQVAWCGMKTDGGFEFQHVPSNMKFKISGWLWSNTGSQWQVSGPETVESGATDVKLVAKLNR